MRLRNLEIKDAPLMHEWMHDKNVVADLKTNFLSKTMDDCLNFIHMSNNDHGNWHMAIVDEEDSYMGTVSLKNIKEDSAEFGITIRSCAMGKGYALWAMKEAIRVGFEKMNINKIYWCVSPDNKRAVRFYDKNGFERVSAKELDMIEGYTQDQIDAYVWYVVKKSNRGQDYGISIDYFL